MVYLEEVVMGEKKTKVEETTTVESDVRDERVVPERPSVQSGTRADQHASDPHGETADEADRKAHDSGETHP